MDDDDFNSNYEPFYHPRPIGCIGGPDGVWMIRVIPDNGSEPFFMTCGASSEADVMAWIQRLILDDDAVDARRGKPRKYQS